ncbi:amp binding protein [Lichtheimia corymbifera JMRC:FSU:9682]|nr:amp binding protein [Lichtheimia corymbifera JMRC:FSU:9682]
MMTDVQIVVIGQDAKHDPKNGIHSLHKLIEQPRHDAEAMVMDPNDISFTICTSGTSGPRKLAAISHGVAALRQSSASYSLITNKAHSYMSCQPISLAFGNANANLGIHQRARTVVCRTPIPFETICALIERFKVERTSASLWTLLDFTHSPVVDKYDLSTLKCILSSGQHVPDAVMKAVKARINADVIAIYGSTECAAISSRSTADYTLNGSEGKILLGRENLRVVDEDGNDAAVGQPGELWVKSYKLASVCDNGYYNNPEASAKAFREDGYYRTGDYFVVDNDGNYQYRGRMSDRIRTKGKTVNVTREQSNTKHDGLICVLLTLMMMMMIMQFPPAFLEDLCYQYSEDIRECCVVGAFSTILGYELPRAYVVLVENSKKDQQAFTDGLVSYVNNRVPQAEMQLSGGAKCLEKLPLTTSYRVDRYKLRGIAQEEVN